MGKWTATVAIVVMTTSVGLAEDITAWTLDAIGHDSSAIAPDAGAPDGTILPQQADGGFIALDDRQRVEPIARRIVYRGGSFSDY